MTAVLKSDRAPVIGHKIDGPKSRIGAPPVSSFGELTQRQQAVAAMIVRGWFNAEIARDLEISIKTVDTHRADVLARLGLRNNVELCLFAIKTGYLEVEVDVPLNPVPESA